MKDLLDKISQDNDWDNFSDVVFNAKNRRTIMTIVEKAIEEFETFNEVKKEM